MTATVECYCHRVNAPLETKNMSLNDSKQFVEPAIEKLKLVSRSIDVEKKKIHAVTEKNSGQPLFFSEPRHKACSPKLEVSNTDSRILYLLNTNK
jgi:hypothetical protein